MTTFDIATWVVPLGLQTCTPPGIWLCNEKMIIGPDTHYADLCRAVYSCLSD